jgi:hypothetical protein
VSSIDITSNNRVDLWLKRLLLAFVLASCVQVWVGPVAWTEPASAQTSAKIPDSLSQRREMMEQTQQTNRMLSELLLLLESGTINVRLVEEKPGPPGGSVVLPGQR